METTRSIVAGPGKPPRKGRIHTDPGHKLPALVGTASSDTVARAQRDRSTPEQCVPTSRQGWIMMAKSEEVSWDERRLWCVGSQEIVSRK